MRRRISHQDHRLCRILAPRKIPQRYLHRSRNRLWPIPAAARGEVTQEFVDLVDGGREGEGFRQVGAVLWGVVSVCYDLGAS